MRELSKPAVQLDDLGQADLRSLADRMLETIRVEYVDEGVLLVMNPPGFEHRRIVCSIVDSINRAYYTSVSPLNWSTYSEDFQWDLADKTGRCRPRRHGRECRRRTGCGASRSPGQAGMTGTPPPAAGDLPAADADAACRKSAAQIRQQRSNWVVIWAAPLRRYRAWPLFRAPRDISLTARTPGELTALMDQVEERYG